MNYAFILVNRENIESSLDMFSNGSIDEPAICEICGTLTKDWAVFNCSNRFCICVPCLHKQHNTSSNK